jgi:hypothetical protein
MDATTEQIAALLDGLAMVPERIARVVTGWDPNRLRTPLSAAGWSAADILAHLRASDAIWTWRIHALLVRDDVVFLDLDERRWADIAAYADAKFVSSLTTYRLHRQDLLTTLRRASPADWQRTGTHEIAGRLSLLDMIARLLEHEDEHCAYLEAQRD